MKTKGNVVARSLTETASFLTDSGTTNAYAVALRPAITAYTTGLKIIFQAANANTAASTLAVNGLTAKTIKKNATSDLSSGDIAANHIVTVVYDGTNFQIGAAGAATGASVVGIRKGTGDPTLDVAAVPGVDYVLPSADQQVSNGLISGGGVLWTGGLHFTVSAATYSLNGVQYSSPQTDLTLSAADATNDRIDIIAVNTSSATVIVQGTPSTTPALPSLDSSIQLQLTFVYVAANASAPSNIATTSLYAENIEWTSSVSSNFNAASTNNPHSGTKDIEATTATTGNNVQLQKPSGTLDPTTQNSLAFYIRSKAAWANNRSLTIAFLNGGTQVGNAIAFKDSSFGFTSSNTTSYQQIIIPISQFALGSSSINQLKFTVAGTGGTIGFYLDDITLQSGVTTSTLSGLPARQTIIKSTTSLANGTYEDSTVNIGYKSASLIQVIVDRACRVRLYATAADRVTDTVPDRPITNDPAPGTGVLAEYLTSASKTMHVSPVMTLYNADAIVGTNIYYRIENRSGSTSTVSVTFIIIPQEQ